MADFDDAKFIAGVRRRSKVLLVCASNNENFSYQSVWTVKPYMIYKMKENEEVETIEPKEPTYVIVADGEHEASNKLELPAASDDTLSMQTLTHSFPGAHGLKYKNPKTGIYRGLMIDNSGTKIYAPADGWGEKIYVVIYQQQPQPAMAKLAENPKRKMMEPDDSYHDTSEGATKQKRLERENERKCSDLIVLGLPYKTTSSQLREYFEHFGGVVVSEIKFDHKTGKHKGFGFVQFTDYDSQVKVLAQQEHVIDGRKCQVKIPNSKVETQSFQSTKMFVGRVQDNMTADDLRSFFISEAQKHNPKAEVIDVFIPKPFRAFAFVTFSDPDICQRIINTQDYVINGQSVCVSPAAPKDVAGGTGDMRSPGGGRYSSGSGSSGGSFVRHSPLSSRGPSSSHYQRIWSSPPGDNMRFPSSDYSGYGTSPRTMGPMDQDPRVVQPPRSQQSRGVTNGGGAAGSSALASDMDALNLNNMNPEAVTAAWQAFWNTLNSKQRGSNQMPQQHQQPNSGSWSNQTNDLSPSTLGGSNYYDQ